MCRFGGNCNNITLIGESAGALSILNHLVNEKSSSLFDRAILMSCPFSLNWKTEDQARKYSSRLASQTGCSNEKCLLETPSWKILSSQPILPILENKKLGDILIVNYN